MWNIDAADVLPVNPAGEGRHRRAGRPLAALTLYLGSWRKAVINAHVERRTTRRRCACSVSSASSRPRLAPVRTYWGVANQPVQDATIPPRPKPKSHRLRVSPDSNDPLALLFFIEPFADEFFEEGLVPLVAASRQGPDPP